MTGGRFDLTWRQRLRLWWDVRKVKRAFDRLNAERGSR